MNAILEVIVCSVADAVAAERGGANRLEIISHYEAGGLTPAIELVREITATVSIPARVMLRETEPFVVRDAAEVERLCQSARALAALPIDGLVLGFLTETPDGLQLDHELLASILACAPRLRATFHRAFEELPDPLRAIAELKRHGQIDTILSRGRGEPWESEVERFIAWERAARPEIGMLLGGGTDAEAIKIFCKASALRAFHVGRAVREGERLDGAVQTDRVSDLVALIETDTESNPA